MDIEERIYSELSKYIGNVQLVMDYLEDSKVDLKTFNVQNFVEKHNVVSIDNVLKDNWLRFIEEFDEYVGSYENIEQILIYSLKFSPVPKPNTVMGKHFYKFMENYANNFANNGDEVKEFLSDWTQNYDEKGEDYFSDDNLIELFSTTELVKCIVETNGLDELDAVEQFTNDEWLMEQLASGEQQVRDGIVVHADLSLDGCLIELD